VEYERNQTMLAANAYGRVGDTRSGRGGRALLAGLICCARCGRRLNVFYAGRYPRPVYRCDKVRYYRIHDRMVRPGLSVASPVNLDGRCRLVGGL
jgi:hypothetical protein